MKQCCTCHIEKDFTCFNKTKATKDGIEKRCKDCRHIYYLKNKDKVYARSRKSIINRGEIAKKYQFDYYRNNSEAAKKRANLFYLNNKDRIREWSRVYSNNKRKNDLRYKLMMLLRGRICYALKKGKKVDRTESLLGCTIEAFKHHLESKFQKGMNWNNQGLRGWHIDHIKPCAKFDLTKESEQRKCFHYTNMQPLWWKDNLEKSDKYEEIKVAV